MTDTFSYDEAVADTAHSDLQGVASGLQASLDDLSGFVARVQAHWDGDEMDLYHGTQAKWDNAAGTVSQILTSVQTALGSTTSSVKDMRGHVRTALQK